MSLRHPMSTTSFASSATCRRLRSILCLLKLSVSSSTLPTPTPSSPSLDAHCPTSSSERPSFDPRLSETHVASPSSWGHSPAIASRCLTSCDLSPSHCSLCLNCYFAIPAFPVYVPSFPPPSRLPTCIVIAVFTRMGTPIHSLLMFASLMISAFLHSYSLVPMVCYN